MQVDQMRQNNIIQTVALYVALSLPVAAFAAAGGAAGGAATRPASGGNLGNLGAATNGNAITGITTSPDVAGNSCKTNGGTAPVSPDCATAH
jgi:hypothetical protein